MGNLTYKGVRDFYPEDERIKRYIFDVLEKTVELYGYEPYNASVLEPTELYASKTSEEIVNEQTYTFTDRGGRSVTLRPEMTPTVARMVSSKRRELGFPLRWYSIQNFFRYEKPQRGRLREFWQLNVDLFGATDTAADAEIVEIAYRVLRAFGATEEMFTIKIADRNLLETAFDASGMTVEQKRAYRKVLDKKNKMSEDEFEKEVRAITENDPLLLIQKRDISIEQALGETETLLNRLNARGIHNVEFDPSIVRGFDYYTGMVFEIFDTSEENNRALFGGGRYDYLVKEYGGEDVPAVGFGMGDVTVRDFLETHTLLPNARATTDLYLAPATPEDVEKASGTAQFLRNAGLQVALGLKHKKISDHIKAAEKLAIPFFAVYGAKEEESGMISIRTIKTKEETTVPLEGVARIIEAL